MKLYYSIGPNPRVVRMFLQEKQLTIASVDVDLMKGENRQSSYLKVNPRGQTPALETDSGEIITEITAICEYIEEINPQPVLIGSTPSERASTRMWCRRIDLNILEPLANGFRFGEGLELFKDRLHCIPQAADDLKAIAQQQLTWLDEQMNGKDYIANNRFSLADIMLFCFLEFGQKVGQPLNKNNKNIVQWYERVSTRASVAASKYIRNDS